MVMVILQIKHLCHHVNPTELHLQWDSTKNNPKIHYGDRKIVTKIDYLRLVKVVNNKLIHDVFQIKLDNDITQMINRWKKNSKYKPILVYRSILRNILNCSFKQKYEILELYRFESDITFRLSFLFNSIFFICLLYYV